MKKKDLAQLKNSSLLDIKKTIKDLEREKLQETIELKMGKIKNVHALNQKRKSLAQAKTILRIKAQEAQNAAS